MKCKHYKKWLHLNRDGELTPRQWTKLNRHLRHCPSCAEEKRGIENADRFIHAARTAVPRPANPEELTHVIMNAVEQPAGPGTDHLPRFEKETNRWLDRFYIPQIRFAMTGIVVFVLGVFIFQGTMILHRIDRLEKKMARRAELPASTDTVFTRMTTRAGVARILEQADLVYDSLPDEDDLVIIRKGTLRRLLRMLIKPRQGEERLIRQLLKQMSLFNEIDIEDGIKKKELKKIMENKKNILKRIYNL